ncbi:hypothetical protein VNO80_25160 [Phaseolus coccineus]|uniref:Uncharacterized protein n=1 Tax=Phaseolus coccineus TaxID=3886 RepID=A0AAN9QPW0_PHACN
MPVSAKIRFRLQFQPTIYAITTLLCRVTKRKLNFILDFRIVICFVKDKYLGSIAYTLYNLISSGKHDQYVIEHISRDMPLVQTQAQQFLHVDSLSISHQACSTIGYT